MSTDHSTDDPMLTAVRAQLSAEERALDVPVGDLQSVMEAGRRRRGVTVAITATAVVLAVAGVALVATANTGGVRDTISPVVAPGEAITSDEPTPEDEESVVLPPMPGSGPELVVTTSEGVVRWRDGAAVPVPGLGADVEEAFPDGAGGIVYGAGGRIARFEPDGTIEHLTEPVESAFTEGFVHEDGIVLGTLEDVGLEDVNPANGRVLTQRRFSVTRDGTASTLTNMHFLTLSGARRADLGPLLWDELGLVSFEASIDGADTVLVANLGFEGGGARLEVVDLDGEEPGFRPVWESTDGALVGIEVNDAGTAAVSLHVRADGATRLVRWFADAETEVREEPLEPLLEPLGATAVGVTDFAGSVVAVTVEREQGARTPALIDLVTLEVTLVDVPGTAHLAPLAP